MTKNLSTSHFGGFKPGFLKTKDDSIILTPPRKQKPKAAANLVM